MKIVQHPHGAWRDRADFLLFLDSPEGDIREQIWARRLDDDRFEVCCVPFFAYGVALGDHVEDPEYKVTKASGRWVIRIFFRRLEDAPPIIDEVVSSGGLVELHGRLVAIDAANLPIREAILSFLQVYEDKGILHWETGET